MNRMLRGPCLRVHYIGRHPVYVLIQATVVFHLIVSQEMSGLVQERYKEKVRDRRIQGRIDHGLAESACRCSLFDARRQNKLRTEIQWTSSTRVRRINRYTWTQMSGTLCLLL